MKKSKATDNYYIFDFVRLVRYTGQHSIDSEGRDIVGKYKALFDNLGDHPLSFHFMLDFTTFQYVTYSKSVISVMGYDILKDGFAHALKNYFHPNDRILLKEIHTKLFDYYYQTSEAERGRLKFHFNYRLKKGDGSWIQLMQQSIFIYMKEGIPVHDFSMCTDITEYKKDNDMTLAVYKLDDQEIYHKVFEYVIGEKWLDEQYQISEREVEIISMVANCDTTKQIASNLNLSIHTVNAHRKNILKKTKCKSFAEVVKKIM